MIQLFKLLKQSSLFFSFALALMITGCRDTDTDPPVLPPVDEEIRAVDFSFYPLIQEHQAIFFNEDSLPEGALSILKDHGVNVVRIRLWKDPEDPNSSFETVKEFSEQIRAFGMKIWLSVHYSDSWADPGQQTLPEKWGGISYTALRDSVYQYTAKIITQIRPDYIQIGNEINNGFLWPHGRFPEQADQFLDLLSAGIRAVRDHSDSTRIIHHFAGHKDALWFFDQLAFSDFDLIGLSYYPWWHGKDPDSLKQVMIELKHRFDKDILIAETAYPFTLEWNDWTHNAVGLESQLILPDYPATPSGQKDYLFDLRDLVESAGGIGLCYWGAEWIAFDGPQSTQGSGWENLALFDFDHQVQPGMQVFRK